jgi:hypothetical protein
MAHYRVLPPVLESSKEVSVKPATTHSLHTQNELRQQALHSSSLERNASRKEKLQGWVIPALLITVTFVTLGIWLYV